MANSTPEPRAEKLVGQSGRWFAAVFATVTRFTQRSIAGVIVESTADLTLLTVIALVLSSLLGIGWLVVPEVSRAVASLLSVRSSSEPQEIVDGEPLRPGGLLPARCPVRDASFSRQSVPGVVAPQSRGSLRGWQSDGR